MNPRLFWEWNARQVAARLAYYADPFAASRRDAQGSIAGRFSSGRISRGEAVAMQAEVRRWV